MAACLNIDRLGFLRARFRIQVDTMHNRLAALFFSIGAWAAGLAVVLSAWLAHAPQWTAGVPPMVQTAVQQQGFHALGLLAVALALWSRGPSRWWLAAGVLMVAGLLLFSVNIYARAFWQWDALRALVPWGGTSWILAWLCLAVGAWRRPGERPPQRKASDPGLPQQGV